MTSKDDQQDAARLQVIGDFVIAVRNVSKVGFYVAHVTEVESENCEFESRGGPCPGEVDMT